MDPDPAARNTPTEAEPMARNTAADVLDREFHLIRAQILSLAASLDRLERSAGFASARSDERVERIRQSLERLVAPSHDRAADVQLLFSDPYDPAWREHYQISPS